MSFQMFAATLRPQPIRNPLTGRQIGLTAGQPDEIWLKLLKRSHAVEKHTLAEWKGLIESYRNRPAYP